MPWEYLILPRPEPRKACWYIKPRGTVHSYLEPLTGLNEKLIEERGVQLEEALAGLKRQRRTVKRTVAVCFTPHCILQP